jgi:hypothetical protein
MWKNVYPARRLARSETKALGEIFGASPSSVASEEGEVFALTLSGNVGRLFFRDESDGGMIDRVWDGYPAEVARAIRERSPLDQPQEIVPDVRMTATVTAEQAIDELAFEVVVTRPNVDTWTYALTIKGGKATLLVRAKDNHVLGQSPEFALEVPPGAATTLAFAHVDDQLIAWQDGSEVQRFDTAAWACRDGCVLPFSREKGLEKPANQKVTPQLSCRAKGKVRFADVRIDRDQHYTRSTAPELIEVPADHYYMLGDNTLQSVDSRGWTAITVGVDENDNVVPPETPGARVVRGNKRAMSLLNAPDRDETPIPIPSKKALVMIDEYGEILRLNAEIGPDWPRIAFQRPGAVDGKGEWAAPETTNTPGISFVPRSDIRGRAVLVFYPSRPVSWLFANSWPGRFGFVR